MKCTVCGMKHSSHKCKSCRMWFCSDHIFFTPMPRPILFPLHNVDWSFPAEMIVRRYLPLCWNCAIEIVGYPPPYPHWRWDGLPMVKQSTLKLLPSSQVDQTKQQL